MNFWKELETELKIWFEEGKVAEFWWRDDDCIEPGPALDILLETAGKSPINLAVIPKFALPELASHLQNHENVSISQHGWSHENHAPADQKKAEFKGGRPATEMTQDIEAGFARLKSLFPDRFLPVFVPPWNRVSEEALSGLASAGLKILSTFNAASGEEEGPRRINTHMDVIDWRGSRGFAGEALVLGQALRHLQAKRLGESVDRNEPTGLLTHHLVHDEDTWCFLKNFNQFIELQAGARWVSIADFLPAKES